jgi:imidazolonepropionase-like amidohydrolase
MWCVHDYKGKQEMICINNVTLIDGTGVDPQPDCSILIDGERIAWIGLAEDMPDDTPIESWFDGTGQYVIPGLIDAHVHVCWNGRLDVLSLIKEVHRDRLAIEAVSTLATILRTGTTTVRDVGGHDGLDVALRDAVNAGTIPGPRMQISGELICMTGGHAHFIGREADGPDELRKAVREQAKRGVDVIKLMATGGAATPGQDVHASQLSLDELNAAVDEAHRLGCKAAAHAHGVGGIRDAVLAGIDSIEHGSYLCEDSDVADLMAQQGTYLVATLGVGTMPTEGPEAKEAQAMLEPLAPMFEAFKRTIPMALDRGVPLASGTDAGGYKFGHHGFSMQAELEALVDHGLSPMQALSTATRNNAHLMGLANYVGTVEAGKYADLVLLNADPLADIRNARAIDWVMKGGLVL